LSLIYLSCAWITGIFLGGWSQFSPSPYMFLAGLAPLLLMIRFRSNKRTIILVSLCFIALIGGAIHYMFSQDVIDEGKVRFYNGAEMVTLRGIISNDPDVGEKTTQIELAAKEIVLDAEWQKISGTTLLFVPRYHDYHYGDEIIVTGCLENPRPIDDFDYPSYLANRGIYSLMSFPEVEILDREKGIKPLNQIYLFRDCISLSLSRILPEPHSSLAKALTLGVRDNVPKYIEEEFSRSGTTHLLAISGLHLSILTGMLLTVGIYLWGKRHYRYIWLTLGMIWLYAVLTGMNPPIIRATVMASLFLVADLLGRQRSAITALTFAAAIMVAIEPQVLWKTSFQMSFAAMTGLIVLVPIISRPGLKLINCRLKEGSVAAEAAGFINNGFTISIAALIGVGPLIALYYNTVSFIGPVATLFTLPFIPASIVSSGLTGVLGLIALPVGLFISWVAWFLISYILLIIRIFGSIPLAAMDISIKPYMVWVYYLILALVIYFISKRWIRGKQLTDAQS